MDAVDWVCFLPHYPALASRTECDEVTKLGGGPVATATALCGRYGLKARFIGSVGGDELGRFSLEDLRREPMDLSCVRVVPGATTQLGIILVDRLTGERTVLWHRDHRLRYAEGELKREWIVAGRLLHLDGCDPDANLQAARWAREAGMKVSLDVDDVQPGIQKVVELTDFLIPSEAFVKNFTGHEDWRSGLRELALRTCGFVAMTRGSEGNLERQDLPAPRLPCPSRRYQLRETSFTERSSTASSRTGAWRVASSLPAPPRGPAPASADRHPPLGRGPFPVEDPSPVIETLFGRRCIQ